MFLGMGVHGEPGISDHSMPSATQLAELLVARLLEEHADDDGNRISVLLNGLGTIKYEELFLLYGRIDSLLRTAGFLVVEPECGELVTSLDMSGLSLSLCWLDDELERYWAAPADTPAYRKGNAVARMAGSFHEPEAHKVPQEASTEEAVRLGVVAAQALHVVRQVVADNVEWLGQLDAVAGDGDHGIGMLRGAEAAADAARRVVEKSAGIRQVLITAGEEWSEKAGGTSGALWSAALMAIGEVLGNKHSYSRNDAAAAVIAMRDAVVELGNAELGDKTMVDAMIPFTDAFTAAAAAGEALPRCLSCAAGQAVKAAEQTASLSPKKGRARALTQRSLGHPDPGAISFGLVMSGLARYFE
jgi:dihydroxyacetone kinase